MKFIAVSFISLLSLATALTPPNTKCDQCLVAPDKNKCDITTSCT